MHSNFKAPPMCKIGTFLTLVTLSGSIKTNTLAMHAITPSASHSGAVAEQVSGHQLKTVVVLCACNCLNMKQRISEKVMYAH